MIKQEIVRLTEKAIKKLQGEGFFSKFNIPEIKVERPKEKSHGDYAINIMAVIDNKAMIAEGSPKHKSPSEIADTIREKIENQNSKLFCKYESVYGFINFFLSKDYLQDQVREILKKREKFGGLKTGRGQKVNIEFISANPTGPLHIGNGRNAFSGDVIANVLGKAGHKVIREYFVNDAPKSSQIIKLNDTASDIAAELSKDSSSPRGGRPYESEYLRSKILAIPKHKLSNILVSEIQKDIKNFIEKKLKIRFDNWVSEKDLHRKSKIDKIFDWLKKKNFVYEKDKAWWIKTSQFGDEKDWVVIRETGEPTYLLSDIAYHKDKFERGFQKIIDIWGADHQAHVSKMKAAAKILGFKGELDILILQLVTLKGREKISKRTGKIITLEELIEEIGLDVTRFFYLQKSLDTHMEIDLALAREQSEKNPVFYIQYAHARICSILRKAVEANPQQKFDLLNHPSELNLIKQLIRLPEIIEDIARDYQVQRLPQYAVDLAATFHQFYRDCKVLTEDEGLTQARLALILATKIAIKNTLDLMGITTPERM